MLTHLHIACGCLCAVSAELSSFDRDHMQSLKFLLSGPLEDKFANLCSRESDSEVPRKELGLAFNVFFG